MIVKADLLLNDTIYVRYFMVDDIHKEDFWKFNVSDLEEAIKKAAGYKRVKLLSIIDIDELNKIRQEEEALMEKAYESVK